MRRLFAAAAALAAVASTGGCSVVGLSDPGTYKVTAYFSRATALYEKSRVKVMGADVGEIDKIRVDGRQVRVELTVDKDVPLPRDVHAAIVPANTLGERNIVLYPPWQKGQPKATPGTVVPQQRTELPVEIDEALTSFTRLAEALDPAQVRDVVRAGARSLEGRGPTLNKALQSTADVTHNLAAQDQKLISVARGLHRLAAGVNRREGQLRSTIGAFSTTSGVLAGEREQLRNLLAGLEILVRRGDVLVKAFERTVPSTVADLSELVMQIKTNSSSVAQTLSQLPRMTDSLIAAWDREQHLINVRIVLSATVRAWLQPIFDAMGWGKVPCSPNRQLANCPPRRRTGR